MNNIIARFASDSRIDHLGVYTDPGTYAKLMQFLERTVNYRELIKKAGVTFYAKEYIGPGHIHIMEIDDDNIARIKDAEVLMRKGKQ